MRMQVVCICKCTCVVSLADGKKRSLPLSPVLLSQGTSLTLNSLEIFNREEFICHRVLRIFLMEISQMCRILRPGRSTHFLSSSHTSSSWPSPSPEHGFSH